MKPKSIATIRAAFTNEVNVVDTAPVYGFGRSEEIVGQALANGLRSQVILATKVGLEWQDGEITRNGCRVRIMREIDDRSPFAHRLHRRLSGSLAGPEGSDGGDGQGDAGALRARKNPRHRRQQFLDRADERFRNVAPLHVVQPPYNLFEREIEAEILPYCLRNGIATFGYGALCRGLLSGKMRTDTKFMGDDLRLNDPKFSRPALLNILLRLSGSIAWRRSATEGA